MKAQIIGFGNVAKSLIELIIEEQSSLKCLGIDLNVVSISDSKGTAIDKNGLNLQSLLDKKKGDWQDHLNYRSGYGALDAINNVESDVIIELTPSTNDGEPAISYITAALKREKDVVTANKGPLVVAYSQLTELAKNSNKKLLYEATVSAQLPVFCLLDSCFIIDKVEKIEGIFNATTNFIIGEIEQGKTFDKALNYAIKAGWAETNYSDDVDGVDSARKLVILANRI
jgi:homoserine dehydrogenase